MPKLEHIPACPDAPAAASSARESRTYQIHLVTPMFGGGVEAGQTDVTMPIRATSIRGQLQFWWRATCGANCSTKEELFVRHADVWGTTENASPVQVSVRDVDAAKPTPCARYVPRQDGKLRLQWMTPFETPPSALPYGLFPFQGRLSKDGRTVIEEPASCVETASFKLCLQFPESIREDVERAVWAWLNFGGLGARTRRGFGSLFCEDVVPRAVDDLGKWFAVGSARSPAVVREWPTLPTTMFVGPRSKTAIGALGHVLELLRQFRQGAGVARNPGQQQRRPGRSRFPEPETIRDLPGSGANRRLSGHQRLADIPNDAFPRAEFGLPIVFHFQGRGEPPGRYDLPDAALYPRDGDGNTLERMASPLILKAVVMAGKDAVPVILRLSTPPLMSVDLRRGDQSLALPPTTVVRAPRLAIYRNSPLASAPSGSATDAFIKFALQTASGFQEVGQ
jgi:CRISPR-associated protein Cmr1